MCKHWKLTIRIFFEYKKSCTSNEGRKEICTSQPFSSTDLLKSQRIFYAAKYPLEMLPVKKRQKTTDCDEKRISGKR